MLPRDVRERAFTMYCLGIPATKISQKLGLSHPALITQWKQKYNWDEKAKDILELKNNNDKNLNEDLEIKLINSVMSLWSAPMTKDNPNMNIINERQKSVKPRDLFEAIKLKRLLRGESTENINVNNEVQTIKEEVKKILEGDDE